MVKKLELAVSLDLPHNLSTPLPLVSPHPDPRYSTPKGTSSSGKRQRVPDAAGEPRSLGDYINSYSRKTGWTVNIPLGRPHEVFDHTGLGIPSPKACFRVGGAAREAVKP